MKTSSRPRYLDESFSSRRGHGAQLSISDTSHHVTEAIGDMYGSDDYGTGNRDSRPLSFVVSPLGESMETASYTDGASGRDQHGQPIRPEASTSGVPGQKSHTLPARMPGERNGVFDTGPLSPTLTIRDRSNSQNDTATQQFPLNNIDYESTPAAVAKEMHNLQALRRMSMDVGSPSDPDLPSFQNTSLIPAVAPTGGDDEDDPSRLFWVPARVHPELAPMEFKTFLENRVQTIKRRSGELGSLSADGIERAGSGSSLRRKKSMLSRQIDNSGGRGAVGYRDGAEQLERKKSHSQKKPLELKISDLQELDELVKEPSKALQKLSIDTGLSSSSKPEVPEGEDLPILPSGPGMMGLRRSTMTAYRRGSIRKGERVPFSKRVGARSLDPESEDSSPLPSPVGAPLARVSTEPVAENFSRPNRAGRRGLNTQQWSPTTDGPSDTLGDSEPSPRRTTFPDTPLSQTSFEYSGQSAPGDRTETSPIPKIVETPPPPPPQQQEEEEEEEEEEAVIKQHQIEARDQAESKQPQAATNVSHPAPPSEPPARSSRRPALGRNASSTVQPIQQIQRTQTLNDLSQKISPLPGGSARTDGLTFIPIVQEEKKPEKKSKKDDSETGGTRKTSWGWFKSSDDKEKKEKKKDEEAKDAKKSKNRVALEKTHDNARLDVLQHSIDTAASSRGRESLVLDRDNVENKLQDERKKESARKSGGESKKDKDGIFSSLFGGGKKKSDRDLAGRKSSSLRTISPEPPVRVLRPDIDYNWTRFTILEERAIYRMAHIKLANPRRALYSQVLLSNFMYSYLAKVQQMHPNVQIPQSAQQKKQQEMERRQKELEQQRQAEQQEEQYRYDYHQGITEYAEQQHDSQGRTGHAEGVAYVDDSQIYDHDHSQRQGPNRPQSRTPQNAENGYHEVDQYGRSDQNYYSYGDQELRDHEDDDDEMW